MRRAVAAAVGGALALPAVAAAHGTVGRKDLPLPDVYFAWGAAIVLVISFVALAALWSAPRFERIPERRLLPARLILDVVLGTLGMLVFAASVYAGLRGQQVGTANLAPQLIFIGYWVGIPVLSLLLGDWFRAFALAGRDYLGACHGTWPQRGRPWCARLLGCARTRR